MNEAQLGARAEVAAVVQSEVLAIHRRNGGALRELDLALPLLHGSLMLDSLDLAEVIAAVERRFHVSPFDAAVPPRSWGDLIEGVVALRSH